MTQNGKNNNSDNFFSINMNDLNGFDGQDQNVQIDFKRYWNHLLKHKFWIAGITVIVAGIFYLAFNLYYEQDFSTTAIVHYNRTSKQNPIEDFDNTKPEGRVEILRTKNFLVEVVDSLRLNLKVKSPALYRHDVFKKIRFDETAAHGAYKIVKENRQFELYGKEKDLETASEDWQLLYTGALTDTAMTRFQAAGFDLTFRTAVLEKHNEIEFSYFNKDLAIGRIRMGLNPQMDRSKTILYINYSDKDPMLAYQITNTIAGLFIGQLGEFSKRQTNSMLVALENQLNRAQEELALSENQVERFRVSNPNVLVDKKGKQSIKELVEIETEIYKIDQKLDYINSLQQKKTQTEKFEDINFVYQEMLSLLDLEKVPGAKLFNEQLFQLTNDRQKLLDKLLPAQNLEVVRVTDQIKFLHVQVDKLVERYVSDLARFNNKVSSELAKEQRNLGTLPRAEMDYAELRRDQQVKEKILEDILERYNEAKLAHAVLYTDAIVIDDADFPDTRVSWKFYARGIGGGLMLGLFSGVALFLFTGFMDKTVKSAKEIQDALNIPVLVTIPVVDMKKYEAEAELNGTNPENGITNGSVGKHHIGEEKLITRDYAPTIENEVFRRLRIKLTPTNSDEQNTVVVTSLNPNEGKSFVSSNLAITFSQQKRLTLLIDGDLRRGVLHKSFGAKKTPGLTDFLLSNCTIDTDNIAKIIQKTYIPNLFMISTGQAIPNPSEVLGSPRMEKLYQFLAENFSTIVIDTPPFGLVPDVFTFKRFHRQVLLVTRYETTDVNQLKEAAKDFPINDMEIAGAVVNASEIEYKKYKNYKYSYYSY